MLRIVVSGLVGLVLGALIGTFVASGLVAAVSGNSHDKSLEVAMTALLFGAPIGALLGATVGILRARKVRNA